MPKVYDLLKAMSPDAPVYRGNWAVFHDLDGPLDLYIPTGHEARNDVSSFTTAVKIRDVKEFVI